MEDHPLEQGDRPSFKTGANRPLASEFRVRVQPAVPPKADPSRKERAQDSAEGSHFALRKLRPRSRLHNASKCNEALSEDLWPLDPFESAPMRATSSALCNSILHANPERLKIKGLAELHDGRAGRNSLLLKNFPCEIFPSV
jgi:hypothetical protein